MWQIKDALISSGVTLSAQQLTHKKYLLRKAMQQQGRCMPR